MTAQHEVDQAHNHVIENLGERFQRHTLFPLHMGAISGAHGKSLGVGSCGDAVEISLRLEDDTIVEIGHLPKGCAYTVACASAACGIVKGKTVDEALNVQPEDVITELGGLPEDHHHCARLAVNTVGEAIADAYNNLRPLANRKD